MRKALYRFFARLRLAVAAFQHGHAFCPLYAVIYDSYEGLDRMKDDPREEFYELFDSPSEARTCFYDAFPDPAMTENPRLVLILGRMEKY
ncbi:hypothetical protein [Shinella zoogloeoides]|uniref:hypothetical protein n=1 Tax=Shinella zoogloeoides TaxID=352475 RepID=UPI00273D1895|nr:hypothetical protein [Shinella zoogloeoides]WLR90913.1 hypothetical protein Q9316_00620 [Shinella zoogloeoides]